MSTCFGESNKRIIYKKMGIKNNISTILYFKIVFVQLVVMYQYFSSLNLIYILKLRYIIRLI